MDTDTSDILKTEEGAHEFLQNQLTALRKEFEENGGITPKACLLVQVDPDTNQKIDGVGLFYIGLEGPMTWQTKELFSAALKKAALMFSAIGVMFVSEAWLLEGVKAPINKNKSLATHPDRKEVALVQFEHKAISPESWRAEITRPEGKRQLGEFTQMYQGASMSGRFVRFLPELSAN